MSNLIMSIKVVCLAWVATAVAYMVSKNFLFPFYQRFSPTPEEAIQQKFFKSTYDRPTRVPWLSSIGILAAGGAAAAIFQEVGWNTGMWIVFVCFLLGTLLGQFRVEIGRRPPKIFEITKTISTIAENSTQRIFDAIAMFFLRLGIPAGFVLLLLIQDDPHFSAEKLWPVAWRSVSADSLSGCVFPLGFLALAAGYHAFSLLRRSWEWREVGDKNLQTSGRLTVNGFWIWVGLVAALVVACLMVRGLGERQVGWAIAGGLLAAFFVTIPLCPQTYPGAGQWQRNEIFFFAFGGFLRLAAIPAVWWVAWAIWRTVPDGMPTHEVLRSGVRGFLVAPIIPVTLLVFYFAWKRDELKLLFRPWPIAVAILLAVILTVPLTVGLTTTTLVGLLIILAGMLLGFLCTGATQDESRRFLATTFVVWLLAATNVAALSPLVDSPYRPVLGPICLLAVLGIGTVYGSWLRRRVSYLEVQ